ncbi:hypothetical protein [Halalkalibacter lacteus]|uniref:hypothetical protein n=1 Tax=Halalkalibacter lacteus TaxID=3090663 RepID=UPI002FC76A3D
MKSNCHYNLSDIRSGNMAAFKQNLDQAEKVSFHYHSILSDQRETELKKLRLLNKGPVVAGGGGERTKGASN